MLRINDRWVDVFASATVYWWQGADPISAIDWDTVSRLVPEVILVLIFVWFVMKRDERLDAAETERTKIRVTEMKERDASWREFLKEERLHRAESTARMAEEIKQLSREIAQISTVITQHDAWERLLMAKAERTDKG